MCYHPPATESLAVSTVSIPPAPSLAPSADSCSGAPPAPAPPRSQKRRRLKATDEDIPVHLLVLSKAGACLTVRAFLSRIFVVDLCGEVSGEMLTIVVFMFMKKIPPDPPTYECSLFIPPSSVDRTHPFAPVECMYIKASRPVDQTARPPHVLNYLKDFLGCFGQASPCIRCKKHIETSLYPKCNQAAGGSQCTITPGKMAMVTMNTPQTFSACNGSKVPRCPTGDREVVEHAWQFDAHNQLKQINGSIRHLLKTMDPSVRNQHPDGPVLECKTCDFSLQKEPSREAY